MVYVTKFKYFKMYYTGTRQPTLTLPQLMKVKVQQWKKKYQISIFISPESTTKYLKATMNRVTRRIQTNISTELNSDITVSFDITLVYVGLSCLVFPSLASLYVSATCGINRLDLT